MKIKQMLCPNCASNLEIEEGAQNVSCKYCGTQINVQNETKTVNHQIIDENKNITQRYIDETKIKEIESQQAIKMQEIEKQKKQEEQNKKMKLFLLVGWLSSMLILLIISVFTMDNVGFSPYQLLLILDIIVGVSIIKKQAKK